MRKSVLDAGVCSAGSWLRDGRRLNGERERERRNGGEWETRKEVGVDLNDGGGNSSLPR